MNLDEMREQLDHIDTNIADLLVKRMDIIDDVARYKQENQLPVFDVRREREKLGKLAEQVGSEHEVVTDVLFPQIFDLSRSRQRKLTSQPSELQRRIKEALSKENRLFPTRAMVACQGTEGSFSQQASERIFAHPSIVFVDTFSAVFKAVDQGLCQYGVLPLENSTAGSVNRIYDLMMEYDFHIARSARLRIDHSLVAKPGTKLSEIREVYSHGQAIAQCQDFVESLEGVKVIPCENTATAARQVQESSRTDIAAISSAACALLYGLNRLQDNIQDQGSNHTRFICISKELEIYPGANRTSLMMTLPHQRGSLYSVLGRFNALDINLMKLESRPVSQSDFEFMFYFDLEVDVESNAFMQVFDDLEDVSLTLTYLGSYSEVV